MTDDTHAHVRAGLTQSDYTSKLVSWLEAQSNQSDIAAMLLAIEAFSDATEGIPWINQLHSPDTGYPSGWFNRCEVMETLYCNIGFPTDMNDLGDKAIEDEDIRMNAYSDLIAYIKDKSK